MNTRFPRALTVQDLSCVGQCSLAAAIPVLAACGVECCPLPTAILSNHTGPEFVPPYIRDLTGDLLPILERWQAQHIGFDGVGIGYLGSSAQLEVAARLVDALRTGDNLILLDPVMGDNDRFYSGFDRSFAAGMARLCRRCDLILPNLTEGCFLLDEGYPQGYDLPFCYRLARRLAGELGVERGVLTGLELLPGQISNLVWAEGELTLLSRPKLPGRYHGTGDLFAAALLGRLLRGEALLPAVERAGAFVAAAIAQTGPDHPYGVRFEGRLSLLMDQAEPGGACGRVPSDLSGDGTRERAAQRPGTSV